MYLSTLSLKNFRGFEDATLALHPRLTVLVGPNGTGKSSLVRGIDLVASQLARSRLGRGPEFGAAAEIFDIKSSASSAELVAEWEHPEAKLELKLTRDEAGAVVADASDPGRGQAPAWLHFGATVRSSLRADVNPTMGTHGRLSGEFVGELSPWSDDNNRGFLPFERFWSWFKDLEDAENAKKVKLNDLGFNDPALHFVRQSVERMLGAAYSGLQVNRERNYSMIISKDAQDFAIEQLSDGERSLIVLGASIARRLALFSSGTRKPVDQAATVLIDEVEQHLHGRWQREILARLCEAFPKVQFVVTTHSPVVLSSVQADQVRVLDNFAIYSGPDRVYGRDANALYEDVFGVPRRPDDITQRLVEVGTKIDSADLANATSELDSLADELGENDVEVIRLRVLADFVREDPGSQQDTDGR